MEKEVVIIEANPNDYKDIAAIYNEYIRLGNATMDETEKAAVDIAIWVDNFNSREKLYVLKENGINIGWGIIKRYSDREGYRFTCETAVYLTMNKTGLGYGTLIKKHLINICEQLKYKHLVAKIFAENEASILYNQNLGYTIVGRQNKIGFKNERWLDIVIMQYIIE